MKIVGLILLAIAVFAAVLLAPLAIKGDLNVATFKRIAGIEEPAPPPSPDDELGPLAQKLKAQQEELRAWQTELEEREARLDQREALLDETVNEIDKTRDEVMAAIAQLDEEQLAALTEIAKTLESMEPSNAAADLEAMEPQEAARLLPLIKDRNAGKILDLVDPEIRSEILGVMQAKKY